MDNPGQTLIHITSRGPAVSSTGRPGSFGEFKVSTKQPLKDINKFRSWLFGIAYNRCHKWFQREKVKIVKFKEISQRLSQQQRMDGLRSGQPGTHFQGDEPEIAEFLHKLPTDVKNILKLKYLEGMSYDEISEKTGVKSHRIDYLIRKGKKLIRERWSQRNRKDQDERPG